VLIFNRALLYIKNIAGTVENEIFFLQNLKIPNINPASIDFYKLSEPTMPGIDKLSSK
jgi:hypothetical protein